MAGLLAVNVSDSSVSSTCSLHNDLSSMKLPGLLTQNVAVFIYSVALLYFVYCTVTNEYDMIC